jgi:hypothetical protein
MGSPLDKCIAHVFRILNQLKAAIESSLKLQIIDHAERHYCLSSLAQPDDVLTKGYYYSFNYFIG